MGFRKKFQKYFEVVNISHRELFATPANFYGRLMIHALRISVFGIVYTYVFESSIDGSIDGFTALNAVWALALVQLIYSCSGNTFLHMKDEIITGQIETKLNKPYSFVAFAFLDRLGQAPVKFVGFSIVTVVVLAIFFGIPTFSAVQIIGLFILFCLGLILHTLNQLLIGLSAFWIENPEPLFWISTKLSWIVNGTFVPLAILPATFRAVSDVFPLSAPFFMGRIFEMNGGGALLKYIGIQLIWILIVTVAIHFVYKAGVKKISINGG